jgi:hypothetical protein
MGLTRRNAVRYAIAVGVLILLGAGVVLGGLALLRALMLRMIVGDASDRIPPYNPDARPSLPPHSISCSIWDADGIPASPISSKPHFVDHPAQQAGFDTSILEDAGCKARFPRNAKPSVECDADSSLAGFGCDHLLVYQTDTGAGLDPAHALVATCHHHADSESLYQVGSLRVGHIFKIDGGYTLVNAPSKMKELFAPIESSAEALSYAQLLTGLRAEYKFRPGLGERVFLQEVIQDSHVTEIDHGYYVHLYHTPTLGCGPYITSEVGVIVGRDGTITWMEATPVYVDLHGLCFD